MLTPSRMASRHAPGMTPNSCLIESREVGGLASDDPPRDAHRRHQVQRLLQLPISAVTTLTATTTPATPAAQPLDGQFWMQNQGGRGRQVPAGPAAELHRRPLPALRERLPASTPPQRRRGVPARRRRRHDRPGEGQGGRTRSPSPAPYRVIYWNAELCSCPRSAGMCAQLSGHRRQAAALCGVVPRPARWSSATWTTPGSEIAQRLKEVSAGGLPCGVRHHPAVPLRGPARPHGRRRGRARRRRMPCVQGATVPARGRRSPLEV